MSAFIQSILSEYNAINSNASSVLIANGKAEPPVMAYRVHLPRLELTVKGVMTMLVANGNERVTKIVQPVGTMVYVPANGWNLPEWSSPVITLSLLFSSQDIGFSVINWDGHEFKEVEKFTLSATNSNIREALLQLTESLAWSINDATATFSHLVMALINNVLETLANSAAPDIKEFSLINEIKKHIENNFTRTVTRSAVAEVFNITPSYLSRLFKKSSDLRFNEYLTLIRIKKARTMLINTNLKIKEISDKCGFPDSNYFCKVFKDVNDCTPLEYRRVNRTV
ncbi:helix-turn-helix transcriptional regulator [Pantoea sp. B65]|uniref:AraC family transcriptional regulator n=1 Tax=Pantoea sp. B65 TaxID=2813359 RepID=UPI0039B5AE3C